MKNRVQNDSGMTPHSPRIRPDAAVNIPQISVSEGEVTFAFREGAEAALQGAHSLSCPYLNDLQNAAKYAAWMEGYGSYKQK
jgi:hypothetical protein